MNDVARGVAEWLPLFFRPDDVLELRFLGVERPGRTHAGWIRADQIPAVAGKVAAMSADAQGAYFTPQRLDPAVLTRARPGHFGRVFRDGAKSKPELTADADVLERRYLLIDIDPVRPAGVCATAYEKAAALAVADLCRATIARITNWPAPLVVDSGNGFHLYVRLPTPQPGGTAAWDDWIAFALRLISRSVGTAVAEVDTKVFNAARIMKVPGTWAKKGPDTKDRPHRPSRVIEVPHDWRPG